MKTTKTVKTVRTEQTHIMSADFQNRLFPQIPGLMGDFGGEPFHIYDERGIRGSVRQLCSAFRNKGFTFKQYYAVKALPKPAIMRIMKHEGCGFDCSSIPELRLARRAGAEPEDIMFTSNNTTEEEFWEAKSYGGCILNLDDISFINKVPGKFPELICFRLNPGNSRTNGHFNSIIGNPVESKYGVPIELIGKAYRRAKKKGARRFGLHTMVCSNDLDFRHMIGTVKLLLKVAEDIHMLHGIKMEFINIGGGIGIPYRPEHEVFDVNSLVAESWSLFEEFEQRNGFMPKLFTECGRFITGPHGVLVNKVTNIYKKYEDFVGAQAAMPALMRPGMYGAYHHNFVLTPRGVLRTRNPIPQSIVGPICENCDRLATRVVMPKVGPRDYIVTASTGAHGSAMGFNYNGRRRVQELLMGSFEDAVVRICRGETYDDLCARDVYEGFD